MKNKSNKTVFVGLSGGVDSSVAAYLLQKQGYKVVGAHIRCWNVDGCDVEEAQYARRAAEHLGIPFYLFDLEKEYKSAVVDYMVRGYKEGITPNPDVMCNKEIKFGIFLKKALEMGADYIATGHYVKKSQIPNPKSQINSKSKNSQKNSSEFDAWKLEIAKDELKDQSYFLWVLTQEQLKRALFPIGDYTKHQVRSIAKRIGLPNADKKDSQGICFIGKVSIKDFLKTRIKTKPGNIVDESGKILGRHEGAALYTIGQRQGLSIGGSDLPYYVKSKDVKKNLIVVAKGDENSALYRKEILLAKVNLIDKIKIPKEGLQVMCRIRYRQPLSKARIFKIRPARQSLGAGENSKFEIIFEAPQKFIAPGQSAVLYTNKREMLGGGVILD